MKVPMKQYMKRGAFDELYTPEYAVKPIIKYLSKDKTIWCPFDIEDKSNYVKILRENGFNVIASHINEGKSFFEWQPDKWDIIVSNPPFSIKTQILKRAYELEKPFCLLLPLTTLEGIERHQLFKKYGLQLLVLDKRIDFSGKRAPWFNASYFCYKVLPKDLMFETLEWKNRR